VKPEADVGAERILGSEATTWMRVTSGGWSVNEHWIVELADGRRAELVQASLPVRGRTGFGVGHGSFLKDLLKGK